MSGNNTPRRPGEGRRGNIRVKDTAILQAGDDLARQLHELRASAAELGYTLACRCTVCRHPLTAERSVARAVGPVCRRRMMEATG
ncbi:DUF6011 domain-containing protein [Gordonia sp. (in: high G+C Gram-positive bacteria)]|jgi:hypothetical protein|uniref:DUF6011 domain-containing protein n=1 Tax=Gordonia sp. (in: high G+C Gram-positive bacteria) TaxID=84139 RepID=UPI003455A8AA